VLLSVMKDGNGNAMNAPCRQRRVELILRSDVLSARPMRGRVAMRKYLATVTAILLISSPAWPQAVATHTNTHTKITTTNGKVTSATQTKRAAACRNEKGVFTKCVSTVKTSAAATVVKDAGGRCRWAAGPNKGHFTKCP